MTVPFRENFMLRITNIHWRNRDENEVKTYVAYVIDTAHSASGSVLGPNGRRIPYSAPLVDAGTGGPAGYVARFGVKTNPIFTLPLDTHGSYAGPPVGSFGVFDAFEGVMVWTDGTVGFGPGGFVGGYYWSGVEVGKPGTGTTQARDVVNAILANPANAGLGVTAKQTTVTF